MPRGKVVSTRRATQQEETNYLNNYRLAAPLWKGTVQITDNSGDTTLVIGSSYDHVSQVQVSINAQYDGGNIASHPTVLIKIQ